MGLISRFFNSLIRWKSHQFKIAVAYTPDSNYAIPFTVSVISLLDNYSFQFPLDIFVVGNQLSEEDRSKFMESIKDYCKGMVTIHWVPANLDRVKKLRADLHFSPIVYLRLLLPDLLDKQLERVLYLDCDTVVLSDISKLYFTELNSHVLLASWDRLGWFGSPLTGLSNELMSLKIQSTEPYFNAGVLIYNLKIWREEMLSSKIINFAESNPQLLFLADQNAINIYFHNRIGKIDFAWNHQSVLKEIRTGKWDIKVLPDDEVPPRILHFVSAEKPWQRDCEMEYREIFHKFWRKTCWKTPDWLK